MDASKDYYLLLEVHPRASQEMMERAKRLLLLRYHPDHNPTRQDWAAEQTRRVLEAYAVLSDPERRAAYDDARRQRSRPARSPASARPAAETPRAKPSRPSPSKTASPTNNAKTLERRDENRSALPSGVVRIACENCGRVSRVPKDANPTEIKCGSCRKPLRLTFGGRMRRRLYAVDDRLEQARSGLLRILTRSSKEKSSR